MKKVIYNLGVAASFSLFSSAVYADQAYCESPWLARGKQLQLTAPAQGVNLNLYITGVNKVDASHCSAQLRVQGQAPVTQLGMVVSAQGDLQLDVKPNNSRLTGVLQSQGPGGMWLQNNIQLQLNGYFFKPANQVIAGQQVATRQVTGHSQGDLFIAQGLPKVGSASVENLNVEMGSAKIGALQTTPTAHGAVQCQSLAYQARVKSGTMSNSIDKKVKNLSSNTSINLTDWYCPSQGITQKTVVTEGKNRYTVELKVLN